VDLVEVVVAVIAGGLITQLIGVYRARGDVRRDDRKQRSDESAGAASAAKNITDAAGTLVKLADEQVEEFRAQIRALQAESSALSTRMDLEIQRRMRAEAQAQSIADQVDQLRERLASMGAQFELADQERKSLRNENGAMKTKLYEFAVGIQTLTRQVREAGIAPAYVLEVPVTSTGRLGPLNAEAVQAYTGP
jgi:predicted RNase H-like nuclease (RuvC/YqgF family)